MKIEINPNYREIGNFLRALPQLFPKYGKVIRESRSTVKVFKVNGMQIEVKSFKTSTLINRVIYKYFRKSKAEKQYRKALRLITNGIGTPEPVGYVETSHKGLPSMSYYISMHENAEGKVQDVFKVQHIEKRQLEHSYVFYSSMN